jgi:Domain of unknown function (DUF397)
VKKHRIAAKLTMTQLGGDCVEVADDSGAVMVRDTTDRDGGTLVVSSAAWRRFIKSL